MLLAFAFVAVAAAMPAVAPPEGRAATRRKRARRAMPQYDIPITPAELAEPVLILPPADPAALLPLLPRIRPPEIPAELRAMLDAAMDAGDENGVDTIVRYARAGDPASADLVLRRASEWRERRAVERDERLRSASAFELWRGRVEAGGFVSTGNSNITGLTGAADLTREGLRWRHRLLAQADFQQTDGITSRERYVLGYQPNYKIDDRGYVYGNAQYESDRFLGYDSRFSGSAGIGYGVLRRPGLTLDLELGPAFRQTDFTNDTMQSSLAARGSMNLNWTLFSGLVARQEASAYVERFNSTVRSVSAIEAKLLGPLSAKLSYTLQYESDPPVGRLTTDTTSRAALVYSF